MFRFGERLLRPAHVIPLVPQDEAEVDVRLGEPRGRARLAFGRADVDGNVVEEMGLQEPVVRRGLVIG